MTTHEDPVVVDRRLDSVQERLRTLAQALADSHVTERRSLLLSGPALNPHGIFPSDVPHTLVQVSGSAPALESFHAVRALLRGLAPIVAREAPHLLHRFAPEIAALDADLAAHLDLQPSLPLARVALTPSERRAHRESEQAFRKINGICQLVVEAVEACHSLARSPLVIWWTNLELTDRPSLLAFRRLDHWLNQSQARMLLVGTLDPNGVVTRGDAPAAPEVERLLDWRVEHSRLLAALPHEVHGAQMRVTAASSAPVSRPLGAPTEPVEVFCARAMHDIRQALFDLNYEHVFLLTRSIIAAITPLAEEDFDHARFEQTWRDLTAGDTYAAIEFSVAGMHRRRDLLVAAWKATALAHTFLDNHQLAVDCYEYALRLADTPTMRAQLCMYLALISGKRLKQPEKAHAYLATGFAAIADRGDADACLERGWLLNVNALMAYQAGHYADAMRMVQEALTQLRPFHHSEATHLKINVISNMSVLLEDTNHLDEALRTWAFFRGFLNAATEIFAKHYQYREGGLRLKAGQAHEALEAFQASFTQASANDDAFHGEVAARACGFVQHTLGDFAEAERWYASSAKLCRDVGNYDQVARSLLAQALCAREQDHRAEARDLIDAAETLAQRLEMPLPAIRQAQHALDVDSEEARNEWAKAVLEPPGSKLNRAFSLITPR